MRCRIPPYRPALPCRLLPVLGGVLLWLAVCVPAAQAQLPHTWVIKADALSPVFGEFKLAFEKRLNHKKFLQTSLGWYYRNSKVDIAADRKQTSVGDAITNFFTSDLNKFFFLSGSFYYQDFDVDREVLMGPVTRLGLRQYFTKKAPNAFYVYLGVHYAFISAKHYDNYNNLKNSIFIHKPGLTFNFGRQLLFGLKKNFAVDAFLGLEYFYLIPTNGLGSDYEWKNTPSIVLSAGLQFGFAFRRKDKHW